MKIVENVWWRLGCSALVLVAVAGSQPINVDTNRIEGTQTTEAEPTGAEEEDPSEKTQAPARGDVSEPEPESPSANMSDSAEEDQFTAPTPRRKSHLSIRADNDHYKTLTLDMLDLDLPDPPALNKFGGDTSVQYKATGNFRVEKTDGVWTLIDPLGNLFYSVGLTSVSLADKIYLNYDANFKNEKEWVKHSDQVMESFGFNTYANWSDHDALESVRRPFIGRVTLIAGYARSIGKATMGYGHFKFKNNVMPVFDPEFEAFAEKEVELLKKYKNDPYLIGGFSDNELPFSGVKGTLKGYLSLDPSDSGHQAAGDWLKRERIDEGEITDEHDREFYKLVMHRYFSVARSAIKKVLPDHLYLGTRFHGMALRRDDLWEISGKYVDVNSVNYYHRWTPEQERILKWEKLSGRPIMVTEFYAKAKESGLDNSKGAGFDVDTLQDRADFYQNYCIGLLRSPAMIGWHWFRYIDDHKPGVECNKGVLNKDFEPYKELRAAMVPINKNVYTLRKMLPEMKSRLLMDEPVKSDSD